MLAILDMIAPLESQDFRIYRQTRTGLLSYPLEENAARAHLAASIYVQMALKPHIIHIVGHTEAHHAATAQDIIEASQMAQRAIQNALAGQADMTIDPIIQARKEELIQDAQVILSAIKRLASSNETDPLTDAHILTEAVKRGILDAPQLKNNRFAAGKIVTRIDQKGACRTINPNTGKFISETQRIDGLVE